MKNINQLQIGDKVRGLYLNEFPYEGVIVRATTTCDHRGETFEVALSAPAMVWGEPRTSVNVSNHPLRQTSTIEYVAA